MKVCLGEACNAQAHRCIYHGWAFRPDGSFIGAPIEKEQMHGNKRSKEELGLKRRGCICMAGWFLRTGISMGLCLKRFWGTANSILNQWFCGATIALGWSLEGTRLKLQYLMGTPLPVLSLKKKLI